MCATRQNSESVSIQPDRRVEKTRESIDRAFVQLLSRRMYDAIRVGDITKKANVGRATFYAHYTSKDDLLHAQVTRLFSSVLLPQPESPWLFDCSPLLRHVREVPAIYKSLAGGTTGARVSRAMQDAMEVVVNDLLLQRQKLGLPTSSAMPTPLLARFIASNFMALMSWWTEDNMHASADEVSAWYRAVVGPVVSVISKVEI